MTSLLIRWLILTASILMAAHFISGIQVASLPAAVFAAALLGIFNVFLRPLLLLLTLPINVLSLGLFTFLINAFLLKITAALIPGFDVAGFWPALLGALIISLVSGLLNLLLKERPRPSAAPDDTIDLHKRGDRWE